MNSPISSAAQDNLNASVAVFAENLSVTYATRTSLLGRFRHSALKDISFSINKGETFGVMGRNGCGKSTLLRILAGIYKHDKGKLQFAGINNRSLLALGLGFDGELSGRDNALVSLMLQGIKKKEAKKLIPEIQEFSELGDFFDQPVRTYSSGMRSRLGFSVGVKGETDLLLIDEVLSVGDQHFKKKAEDVLLQRINGEQTVVFVSHSAGQVKKLCKRAIWIEQGTVAASGNTRRVAKKYQDFMDSL
ncbi:ABC transporter ATP-binding protein [Reinekea marinisedimentorum]|uniref:Lipopolysaccharide transport system ATP-binding protein n=1 Tax=Reinekea marinisedimentorum TaxID=230495 RepID=A0A4R3I7F6_9GAMM|nr:ATP-binding cassette domain-containing protein [Reinekea marinisedimentorum]TCS41957.1 lipopolysaccharide transport system ATP-binding protein [Reinekea marinisedimentorum]